MTPRPATTGPVSQPEASDSYPRVIDELRWAQTVLSVAGVESPRADAEWLLASVLGVERGRLAVIDTVDTDVRDRFRGAIERRSRRIPLQHIIGTAHFGPAELTVGPGVFIPRPETEFLLEWAAAQSSSLHRPAVVDLCSGSGALAIAVALMVPTARVHAVEKSPAALEWLRRNVSRAGAEVASRITVHAGDVTDLEQMRALLPVGAVDVVVANPPYVPSAADVAPEVYHDPSDAVFGGADGMTVIGPMLAVIAELLRPGGVMGLEHDDSTAAQVMAAVDSTDRFGDVRAHTDLTGRPRFVTARRVAGADDAHGRMAG
ncbi:peptide chain release factor N(5)-glutamine methyltransferase [Gordonia rhizosphera]|uniref:Release factor glutamine methyltransferase n=1 Tax=Gordonia rhizosphera NBRC 16068 TaxID=1108045 RepID=K6UYH3_9ACTN|nr:peptide chain release factor N(5)-glutamine methyltransferase [Gordonia rhizosphera]GAB88488.1 putative protein methyltransferase [Gordonia rhizosphera NBRC 16068]